MNTTAVPADQRSDPSWLRKHPLYKHSHQWIDRVDLAMARRIAEKIRAKPELMEIAWAQLKHGKKSATPGPPVFASGNRS
jgi:hypothetical protein